MLPKPSQPARPAAVRARRTPDESAVLSLPAPTASPSAFGQQLFGPNSCPWVAKRQAWVGSSRDLVTSTQTGSRGSNPRVRPMCSCVWKIPPFSTKLELLRVSLCSSHSEPERTGKTGVRVESESALTGIHLLPELCMCLCMLTLKSWRNTTSGHMRQRI